MEQVFGKFTEEIHGREYLTFGFAPSLVPHRQRWQKNGLLAELVADYVAISFLTDVSDLSNFKKQKKTRDIVSYIINELLQNAMQYNDEIRDDIGVQLQLNSNHLTLHVTNSVIPDQVSDFQAFIQKLLNTNLEQLYIQQMTQDIEDEDTITSGLGLLTIMHDHNAQLGWKFATVQTEPKIVMVTTMVQLII